VNASIALVAWIIGRRERPDEIAPVTPNESQEPGLSNSRTGGHAVASLPVLLGLAALSGFVFLLMELVWYRMLSPILGGTAFTFGLILAVALLGIGLGGAAYAIFRGNKTATLTGFALTCGLEALFIALPFAIGDRLALASMLLRTMSAFG